MKMANPVPALKTTDVPRPLCRGSSSDIPPQTNVVPYTVQEGETLVGIALKHRMNHSQIRRLNSLFGSNTLYPGQILFVFHLNNPTTNEDNDGATSERQVSPKQASAPKPMNAVQGKDGTNQIERDFSEEQKMYENIQLCVKDSEFCRLVPGDLVLNGHYLAFLPIASLSPKQKDGRNTFEFRLDLFEIDNVAVVPISTQAEEDYVKVTWKNEANQLSSLFFIAASDTAKLLAKSLTEYVRTVQTRPRQADSYTSGKCLRSGVDFDINSLLTEPSISVDRQSSSFKIDLRRTKSAIDWVGENNTHEATPVRRKRNSFGRKRSTSTAGQTERRGSKYLSGARQGLKKSFSFLKYLRSSSIAEEGEEYRGFEASELGLAEVVIEEAEPREPPSWFTASCASTILDEKQATELRYALPKHMQAYLWLKLYDFARDGVSLEKLYQNVCLYPTTLMVIRTTTNDTLGAYCSEPWGMSKSHQFYGTGECFVFNFKERKESDVQSKESDVSSAELIGEEPRPKEADTYASELTDAAPKPKKTGVDFAESNDTEANEAVVEVSSEADVEESEFPEEEPKPKKEDIDASELIGAESNTTDEDVSEPELCVYSWTKTNNFFMNSSSSHLGVGGGGDGFAISLDSDLNHGTTNCSATFGNPVLVTGEDDGQFQILSLEMFGFESSRSAKRRMSSIMSETELFSRP